LHAHLPVIADAAVVGEGAGFVCGKFNSGAFTAGYGRGADIEVRKHKVMKAAVILENYFTTTIFFV